MKVLGNIAYYQLLLRIRGGSCLCGEVDFHPSSALTNILIESSEELSRVLT